MANKIQSFHVKRKEERSRIVNEEKHEDWVNKKDIKKSFDFKENIAE